QLPPPGYKPRAYDPRGSFFGIGYMDYATPISEPIVKRFIARHRLEKKDPKAAVSEAVRPIVYYLDRGAPEPIRSALLEGARWWQLAAHEVGHTLGLMHNYSASTVNRASVMDYPPPYVKLSADGVPDLSAAYATGIGDWDKVSIAFGYQDFAPGANEQAALNKILLEAYGRGLRYLTDQDARPAGSSSSLAHLWDSGANAVDELNRLMQVRGTALKRFGENNIREGAPLATLEDVLVPVYMLHRYQVEAASKLVGGMDYTFALRGDGQAPTQIVGPAEQRRALAAVLATLKPEALAR